jgi:large subunit ribosomal protein L5e
MEEIYKKAYAAIRKDPIFKPSNKDKDWATESKKHKSVRLTDAQRKEAIQARIKDFHASHEKDE